MPSVLVTGAGRGIGRTIAEQLATHCWDFIAGVRNEADGAHLTTVDPQRISALLLDVTDEAQLAASMARCLRISTRW